MTNQILIRTNKQRVIRTLRVKNLNVIGTLASLISAASEAGADIGNVRTVHLGEMYNIRDITIIANDTEHLKDIISRVEALPNVVLKQVIDDVLELHHHGKIKVVPKYPVESIDDLRKVYTPGVAEVCALIKREPEQAYNYTSIPKSVALITNGSRVLGLGNLGPVPSLPVMEGKAALFSQLTGLNMYPILLETRDPKKFIETVVEISQGFGAIQLEDIESPAVFEIEAELIKRIPKPVMHDDQHGTAVVTLAAVINSCRLADKDIKTLKIGQLGLGAAGQAIGRLIGLYTGNPVYGSDINESAIAHFEKHGGIGSTREEIMSNCDLVVMTTGRRKLIKPEMIRPGQIILPLSNPYPEITIAEAREAGAAFALDGTRVNNLLGYPGIFKGALLVRSKGINSDMCIAAAQAIADAAPEREALPDALDKELHEKVARAVAQKAIDCGLASHIPDREYLKHAGQKKSD